MPQADARRVVFTALRAVLVAALLLPAVVAAEMESALAHRLSEADLRGTVVSVCVMDLGREDLLAEIEAGRAMIPASNMKLVTTAAALDTLGKDFLFSTKLRLLTVNESPAGDGLPALVIEGDGDPAFGAEGVLQEAGYSVDQMVGWWLDAVEGTGLNHFGQLVIDDRVFENGPDERVHPTWPANQLHRWYCAQVMGLNFFDNCFQVTVTPTVQGQDVNLAIYPYGPFVRTELRVVTGRADQWDIITRPDSNQLAFRGTVRNAQRQFVAMHDPAMVFGQVLKHELSKRGVRVDAVVRPEGDQRLAGGRVLHQINTTLQAVLNRTNRDSMNLYAEALLKRSGHELTGAPGSFENGAAVVRRFLARHIDDPTLAASIQLADGSGLSRDNRVSTRGMVEVLRVMAGSENFRPYLASMARPGREGSIQDRFGDAKLAGDLYAKTGTINSVSALSGYLVYPASRPGGPVRVLGFSIICNGHGQGAARDVGAGAMRDLQDDLVKLIDAEYAGVGVE